MTAPDKSILLIGESDVGKSHYGGQLLKRLMQEGGRIRMDGQPTNLEPFEAIMVKLDTGLSADHTATTTYHESRWPIADDEGRKAELICRIMAASRSRRSSTRGGFHALG